MGKMTEYSVIDINKKLLKLRHSYMFQLNTNGIPVEPPDDEESGKCRGKIR